MTRLYSAGVYALIPVLYIYFFWRSLREPEYRDRLLERLGYIRDVKPENVWVHAASVGEVHAAILLINALLARDPRQHILLTTFTPAGSRRVRDAIRTHWGRQVDHCYLPLDTPTAVRRFLRRARPRCGLIVETEIWPNLLLACQQSRVPVSMVSGTLSARSLERYQKSPIRRLIPQAMASLTMVLAQTDTDASHFRTLGVPEDRLHVIGNLKFDYTPPPDIEARAQRIRQSWHAEEKPIWAAISTHEGEEQQVLDAFVLMRQQIPDLLLVLVPRHPQRFARSYRICQEAKLSTARYSNRDHVDAETEVVLGDTIGDSLTFMALADVCFIGGSLVPIGGHNLLEPAALARCVLTGPHTESQQQLRDRLAERGGLLEVDDARSLAKTVRMLLASPAKRHELGQAARSVVTENQGVINRMLDILSSAGALPK